MKRIHLTATDCNPARNVLVRPFNEFTLGYTCRIPHNDPSPDKQVKVVRDKNGQLYFVENKRALSPSEFAQQLIRLIAPTSLDTEPEV